MKKYWYHLIFAAACLAVLAFLLRAPKATTPSIPNDADHRERREYTRCPTCHGRGSTSPMPEDHLSNEKLRSDHVKCYFCHKTRES